MLPEQGGEEIIQSNYREYRLADDNAGSKTILQAGCVDQIWNRYCLPELPIWIPDNSHNSFCPVSVDLPSLL